MSDSTAQDAAPALECAVCHAQETLQVCSGCKKVQYCSRECQAADWKSHKPRCSKKTPKAKRLSSAEVDAKFRLWDQSLTDPRYHSLRDLFITANTYSSVTFEEIAWFSLGLDRDRQRSNTHFIAVTVSRETSSNDPRTLHSFLDIAILPVKALHDRVAGDGPVLLEEYRARAKEPGDAMAQVFSEPKYASMPGAAALLDPAASTSALVVFIAVPPEEQGRERDTATILKTAPKHTVYCHTFTMGPFVIQKLERIFSPREKDELREPTLRAVKKGLKNIFAGHEWGGEPMPPAREEYAEMQAVLAMAKACSMGIDNDGRLE